MSFLNMFSNCGLEEFIKDDSKKFENGVFANGIWQRRKEPVGIFTIQMQKFDGKPFGLTKECEFSFESTLPKMPITILQNIHKLYLDVYAKFKSEVYVSVYWDKKKQDYFLYIPVQQVSGASVRFENNEEMLNNPDYFIVMDSHSHNTMSAFWSAQDIKDQASSRLFSVLGKITSEKPEILITAGANRQEVKLSVEQAFDVNCKQLHPDSDYSIPESQIANITEYKYTPPVVGGYKYDYGKYDSYKKPVNNTINSKPNNSPYYGGIALKSTLISKIHAFSTMYTLSSLKVQELLTAFLDYFEDEILTKDTVYSTDLKDMESILDNMLVQADSSFDLVLDQFNLKNKDQDALQLSTQELDDQDINDYALQSYTPNHLN